MKVKELVTKLAKKTGEALLISSIAVTSFAATNGIIAFAETVTKTVSECGTSVSDGADYIYLGDGLAWEIQSKGNIDYANGDVCFCTDDIRRLAAANNALLEKLE